MLWSDHTAGEDRGWPQITANRLALLLSIAGYTPVEVHPLPWDRTRYVVRLPRSRPYSLGRVLLRWSDVCDLLPALVPGHASGVN